jgi:hypothetical protein
MAMPAWVAEAGVVAQVIIATAAIFGERIRARLGPRLRLQLVNPKGQAETLAGGTPLRFTPARYYHARVTNRTAHPEAREVEVLLTQLDIRGPDGLPQTRFGGAIPLAWQHYQTRTRTIGRASVAIADLFAVHAGAPGTPPMLFFTPQVLPVNFPAQMIGEQHFWLSVIARGLNGESNIVRLRVDWDGAWAAPESDMAQHLIVKVEP